MQGASVKRLQAYVYILGWVWGSGLFCQAEVFLASGLGFLLDMFRAESFSF